MAQKLIIKDEFILSTFRANLSYEAVPYNRLSDTERQALSPWRNDSDSYGVLRPVSDKSLPLMAISRDTALLFLTLQKPGPLPDYITASINPAVERALKGLVLDRVLEIKGSKRYVSGPEMVTILGFNTGPTDSKLMAMSRAAACYAHALDLSNPAALAFKLYLYNRLPASRRWRRILHNREAVLGFLGIGPSQTNETALKQYWSYQENTEGWISFTNRMSDHKNHGPIYKIYVSPKPEALPDAFGTICDTLARSGAMQFKVGDNVYGLLRPDKLVAYFANKETLLAAAEALSAKLSGLPVQGVPFTADAGGDGLLSWGLDPLGGAGTQGLSWRQWITARVATALIIARSSNVEKAEVWRFALGRLGLEGVDPDTLAPTASWTGARLP